MTSVKFHDNTNFRYSRGFSNGEMELQKSSTRSSLNNTIEFRQIDIINRKRDDKRKVLTVDVPSELRSSKWTSLTDLFDSFNKKSTSSIVRPQEYKFIYVISSIFLLLLINAQRSSQEQQGLCPKQCTCDNQNLEIICKGKLQASSIPHTFNPNTKRLVLNYGQTTSLIGVDYMSKLEYLDLATNRISSIEFDILTKNINLVSLNISHNNLVELRDTNLMNSLTDLNINLSSFNQVDLDNVKVLNKLTKINIVDFNLAQNNITTLKDLTFIRWHKLQHLDLSYNQISIIEPLALFGLVRIETLNLRHNLLLQVPTAALHSTTLSVSSPTYSSLSHTRSSSIKQLDLSENILTSIESDSFAMLEKAQEIYLESCSIETIDEQAFKGLHTLYLLSLDRNNLQEVPTKAFIYLGLLRSLRMNGNKFSSIQPRSFTGLANLEELQLNNGSFHEVVNGVFDGLDVLRRLEIGFNPKLTEIASGTFGNLTRLTYLSLYMDSLSTLSDVSTDNLAILDLRENPLYCACELKWLTRWLKKFNSTDLSHQRIYVTAHLYEPTSLVDSPLIDPPPPLTNELLNLTCSGPPALIGKPLLELPDIKLECLKPASELNLHVGFGMLFLLTFILTSVCIFNFCKNKKQWLVMLKENLVQNHISMMISYSENLETNVDYLKKETQLYGSDYESIDYHNGQIFTVQQDQLQRHNTIGLQQMYQQEI